MRGAGAALIMLSCLAAALSLLRRERERVEALRALERSLGVLAHELTERQTGLPELFAALTESAESAVTRSFYAALCSRMDRLGEERFSALWKDCVNETLRPLGEDCVNALLAPGILLGGCDLEEQRASLELSRERLRGQYAAARSAQGTRRKLTLGALLSAGAFVVILLM